MKKLVTAVAAASLLVAFGAPAAQAGKGGVPSTKKIANKLCHAEKRADKAAFRETYGPKRAMRNCKRQNRDEAREIRRNAAQECRAQRSEDADAFRENYGTNRNGRNAFGKCVSTKVREEIADEVEEPVES